MDRFVNCEEWRKKFGTDDLPRTFEYPEKPDVFKFYPQYYHKTDKVGFLPVVAVVVALLQGPDPASSFE